MLAGTTGPTDVIGRDTPSLLIGLSRLPHHTLELGGGELAADAPAEEGAALCFKFPGYCQFV